MPRDARAEKIEEAAYKVLIEKGFKGASMLAVARAARASNETLYNWYGDKVGLFSALVARNAATIADRLEAARAGDSDPLTRLTDVAEALLTMLTGARAVALNRAAAADQSDTLGKAIAQGGRDRIAPLLAGLLADAQAAGAFGPGDAKAMTEDFLGLLIGDLQIRRAIGAIATPDQETITARTNRAVSQLQRLYPA